MNAATSATSVWGERAPGPVIGSWIRLCRSLPAWAVPRRIALWLRSPLKRRLAGPVDTCLWGLKLRLHPQGNLSEQRWLFLPQFSDLMERRMLAECLREGGTFLDIGANAGFYSFWVAATCGGRTRVEAFEPDPELCGRIRFNCDTNRISSIHLNQIALSDHEGAATLRTGHANRGTNRLESAGAEGLEVRMTTLAAFLREKSLARIEAMKIDVEGHEATILGHFFQHAPRTAFPKLLVCETLDKGAGDDPLRRLIEDAGYRPAARGRMNTVFRLEP